MNEESSSAHSCSDRQRLSPRDLRSSRRFSERVVTIHEEEHEEEKQEIEPCNYDNLFVETVGEHQFFRRRRNPATPPSTQSTNTRNIDNDTLSLPNLGSSPSSTQRCLRMDWEGNGDESDENDDPSGRTRLLVREHRESNPPTQQDAFEARNRSLEWSQYKAILSKNFKLYSSCDVYFLAILILVCMLIIPYQHSFVSEKYAMSYHSYNLAFPGSFNFFDTQDTDFWVKLFTGHDGLTPDSLEDIMYENLGADFTEAFFDTFDKESLVSFANGQQVKQHPWDTAVQFRKFQNDALSVGRRLLRHPVPTPNFQQFIWARKNIEGSLKHFNYTVSQLGTLHITPPFPDFEDYLRELHPSICYDVKHSRCDVMIRVHEDLSSALDFVLEDIEPTWALLDFTEWDKKYEIRMDPSVLPSTPVGDSVLANSHEYQMYYTSGFLTLQKTIDEYAFVVADRTAEDNCYRKAIRQTVVSIPMPTRPFRQNTFLLSYDFLVGLACIATLLAPISKLILAMVGEKEKKLKSMLNVAGVYEWLINLSWLSFAFFQVVPLAGMTAVLLKIFILKFVKFWKLLLWMEMVGVTAASFSFCFGVAFEQARLAAALAPAMFLATTLPRFLVFGLRQNPGFNHSWVGLFPGSAICFGVDSFMSEDGGLSKGGMKFFTVIGFLLVDSIILACLGMVLTSIDASRTALRGLECNQAPDEESVSSQSSSTPPSVRTQRSYHQVVSGRSEIPMMSITGLTKKFRYSKVPIIGGIDFAFYRGEIGVLLGQNGAGKSTLAWIMAGLMRPSSGDCIVQGVSLHGRGSRTHYGVGFCPQANILYEKLTVYEHLEFFARLHGAVHDKIAVKRRARCVGLESFLHTPVSVLSHGNKRKLSFAVARYGRRFGVIVLDEPFAGQDHESQKLCWNCLHKDKESCAVVLITHDLVEAERRADQVIVMKDGVFHASGTPHFLKQRFSLPYRLTITACHLKQKFFESTISDFILSLHGLNAQLIYSVGNSFSYHVPTEGQGTLPILLDSLDRFVRDKTISVITLDSGSLGDLCRILSEDVDDFLSTNSTMASTECYDNAACVNDCDTKAGDETEGLRVEVSWTTQVMLICWKRWRITSRQTVQLALRFVLFAVVVALAVGVLAIPTYHSSPSVELTPEKGKQGEISLVVGGGATLVNPYKYEKTMKHEFDAINASFSAYHGSSIFEPSLWNSSAMTRHLYSRHISKPRGAFVLFDVLPFYWDIDWPYYQEYFTWAKEAYEGGVGNKSLETNRDGLENLLSQTTGGTVQLNEGFEGALIDMFVQFLKGAVDSIVVSELQRERPRQNGTKRVLFRGSIHHNTSYPHSIAQYNKAYFDSAFYSCSQKRLAKAKNNPLPMEKSNNPEIKVIQGILTVLLLLVPLCSFASLCVVFHTEEKRRNASFLQLKNGVSLSAFWVANCCSDVAVSGVLPFITLGTMAFFGENASMFIGNGRQILCSFSLLLGFSLSVVPFSYLITRHCRSGSNAQIVATLSLYATGLVPLTTIYAVEGISMVSMKITGLRWLLRISPAFALGEGLVELSKFYWFDNQYVGGPFATDVSGSSIMCLYGSFLPVFALFLFLEVFGDYLSITRAREWLSTPPKSTEDGLRCSPEANSGIVAISKSASKVYVCDLTKILEDQLRYLRQQISWLLRLFLLSLFARDLPEFRFERFDGRHKVVLENLNVSISRGETMAILGASGSGKSTLLGLFSGLILPSRGRVESSHGISMKSLVPCQLRIGFCPQKDPFWDYLTGRETLVLYGRICGISEKLVNKRASKVIKQVDLEQYADDLTMMYCGGSRRKLTLGISMIGDPSILLIDESSSGLDPIASAKVWKSISNTNRAVILATHSHSEAAALSSRITIISQGQLRPLLFTKEGRSATLSVDILFTSGDHRTDASQSEALNAINVLFPGRELLEQSPSVISISCGQCSHSMGEVLERIRSDILTLDFVGGFKFALGTLEIADEQSSHKLDKNVRIAI